MNFDSSGCFLMSIQRSRATTFSGRNEVVGKLRPAILTISRVESGRSAARRISSTTERVLIGW